MGRIIAAAVFAVATVAALLPVQEQQANEQASVIAIVNGRLWDGTGAPVVDDGIVLIEDGRVLAAGAEVGIEVPEDARTIDADGGFIMPGVIDNHMHLEGSGRLLMEDYVTPWLKAGVTTLVNNGGYRDGAVLDNGIVIDDAVEFMRATYEGLTERPPRMLIAGPILTAPGGYPATRSEPGAENAAQFVDGPDDARARVARLIDEQHVDLIKIAIERGFGVDYDEAGWPTFDEETLVALVEATHERGRTIRAHVTDEGELLAAVLAGVDVAAHTPTDLASDEVLQEAVDADMIFVTTANIWGSTRSTRAALNAYRFLQLGGRVALGTDFPFQPGSQMPVKEMQTLIDAGFTPRDILIAATRDGAAAVGREADMGTLEPGKLADVIVVDGEPLADISDMANVSVVLLEGEVAGGPASMGDADCSGKVTSVDAALILQLGAGLIPDLACPAEADVDASGDVNSRDATLVLQFVGGLLPELG